ncbi:MAG: cell wall hydrolase [Brevundimonas sp.]|nr:MAG: cell wall hydrolase [Brevundimonas sp.]
MTRFILAAAGGAILLAAAPVLAQTTAPQATVLGKVQASTAPAPAGSEEWLRQRGESYSAAPDAEQNPAEVAETIRLNAEIAARNDAAERAEAESTATFERESARWREETARLETQRVQYEADLAAANAARAAYERAQAAWEAEVAACERARRVCVTAPPAKY